MKSHYRGHKMAIWLNLIPQLHQPGDDDVSMRHHHFHERADHYYQGVVQPESQTRLPPPYFPPGPRAQSTTLPDCLPNVTDSTTEEAEEMVEEEPEADEAGILQRLADSGYHSYAAALGVTVGVGCLLLVLNVLIFAGIYYQRDKGRRRRRNRPNLSASPSESGTELSQRPPDSSRGAHVIKLHEPPPCYNAVTRSPLLPEPPPPPRHKEAPLPPVRTSSNLSTTVKKRVQIQEISV